MFYFFFGNFDCPLDFFNSFLAAGLFAALLIEHVGVRMGVTVVFAWTFLANVLFRFTGVRKSLCSAGGLSASLCTSLESSNSSLEPSVSLSSSS